MNLTMKRPPHFFHSSSHDILETRSNTTDVTFAFGKSRLGNDAPGMGLRLGLVHVYREQGRITDSPSDSLAQSVSLVIWRWGDWAAWVGGRGTRGPLQVSAGASLPVEDLLV